MLLLNSKYKEFNVFTKTKITIALATLLLPLSSFAEDVTVTLGLPTSTYILVTGKIHGLVNNFEPESAGFSKLASYFQAQNHGCHKSLFQGTGIKLSGHFVGARKDFHLDICNNCHHTINGL